MKSRGSLFIADISGYTKFVTSTELEHADGILRQIFETLLPKFSLPLKVSNLQGDAIFAYTADEKLASGQYMLDFAERIYGLFSQTRDRIKINTDCPCKACAGVGDLDLKIVLHHGEYTSQEIGDRTELAGPAVVAAFRLLKNDAAKTQEMNAYALITEDALRSLDLGKYFDAATRHSEIYEHLGEISFVLHDLAAVWAKERDRHRIRVTSQERLFAEDLTCTVPLSPEAAFALVSRPDVRVRMLDLGSLEKTDTANPRFEVGTTYRCHHGKEVSFFEIIDWRLGEYITNRIELPFGLYTHETLELIPDGSATLLMVRYSKTKGGTVFGKLASRPLNLMFAWKLPRQVREQLDRFTSIAEETVAEQQAR